MSILYTYTSLVVQMVKHLPTMRETWVRSLGRKDLPEKEMATHSSTFAWKIPWTEEHGRLQFMGLQRVGHNWATKHHHHNTFLLEKSCRKSIIFKTKKFHQIQLLAPKFVRANRLEVFDCVQEKQLTHLPGMTNFVPSDYIWWKCLLFTFANQKWLPQSEHGQSDVVSWKLSEVNVSKWISTSIGSV